MAKDTDYADLLEELTLQHQARLADALDRLEERITELMATAPLRDGKLYDLEWAIAARVQLKAAINTGYLVEVQEIIKSYKSVTASTYAMLKSYNALPTLDPVIIRQLQTLSFKGFEAIANEYLDILSTEVYQSTLTNRAFAQSLKTIKQTINGVYIQSDNVEAQKLVEIAKNGTAAASAAAVEKLQTIYARDRVGNNLKRYSNAYAQDSLMQFDASVNVATGRQNGATKWKYFGGNSANSRSFCLQHEGKTYTDEQIAQIWAGSWKGKSSSDAMIARGGYNCEHHWRPIYD